MATANQIAQIVGNKGQSTALALKAVSAVVGVAGPRLLLLGP